MTGDAELSRFKQEINLCDFATSYGYERDQRESSVASTTMRRGRGEKIIIAKAETLDWIYCSVHDNADSGTIIDFIQHREKISLGRVRQKLREWLGGACDRVPPAKRSPDLAPVSRDRTLALQAWERAQYQPTVPYLEARGLGRAITTHPRFVGSFRTDHRRNVLFPHYDKLGLCGFEIKNQGFTGFSSGGIKGMWASVCYTGDRALVITESAIDALSFFALHSAIQNARYISTGGALSTAQPALLQSAAEKMPSGSVVFLATDRDEAGEALAAAIAALMPPTLEVRRMAPPAPFKDWNDALKAKLEG